MMPSIKSVIPIVILTAALAFGGCASSQDIMHLKARVAALEKSDDQLRAETAELQSALVDYGEMRAAEEQDLRNQGAGLRALVEQLREENRQLKGKLEETLNLMREGGAANLTDTLESIRARIEANLNRLIRLEQYMGLEPSETMAVPVLPDRGGNTAAPDLDLYAFAKRRLDQGDYETARATFARLLQQYPKSENADNAQFWIGESYYQEKWYDKAILEYQEVIEKYPKGNKVAAAYLKQGFAFEKIGDKTNAQVVLKELIRKYPNAREAQIASDKLKTMR